MINPEPMSHKIIRLWQCKWNTDEIAQYLKLDESVVYNTLAGWRS